MKKQISVANLVMLIGGAVTFLFSFFKFIGDGDSGASAWNGDYFAFFPVATIVALLGLAALVVGILELVGTNLPHEVLTFNWRQIKFTWGIVAAALMLAFAVTEKGGGSLKLGGIMMLLVSLAMAVGAAMGILGKGTDMVNLPDIGGSSGGSMPPPPPPQ
jgi:hypothetical protein